MRRYELPDVRSVVSPRIAANLSEAIGRPAQLPEYPYLNELMQIGFFSPQDAMQIEGMGQQLYAPLTKGVNNVAQIYQGIGPAMQRGAEGIAQGIGQFGRGIGAGLLAAGEGIGDGMRERRREGLITKRQQEAEAKEERRRQNIAKAMTTSLAQNPDPDAQALLDAGEPELAYEAWKANRKGVKTSKPAYKEMWDPQAKQNMLYAIGEDGQPVPVGPAARKNDEDSKIAEKEQGKQELSGLVADVAQQYNSLYDMKAISAPEFDTGENLGAGIASSGPGQYVGRMVGKEAQQYRDNINTMRTGLLQAIKRATGMTGTELNSNVELQLYLKQATDPSMGYYVNMNALRRIDEMYGGGTGIDKALKDRPQTLETVRSGKAVPSRGDEPWKQYPPGDPRSDPNNWKQK